MPQVALLFKATVAFQNKTRHLALWLDFTREWSEEKPLLLLFHTSTAAIFQINEVFPVSIKTYLSITSMSDLQACY